jgi:chemotaxis protein methyltransferase CheR
LRIWSAGCSTGQEPYTIALSLLAAYPELKRWDFRILATDIDTNVVAKAASGLYPETELSGLSPDRTGLFERAGAGQVRVPMAARELIAFKPLNLMSNPWPMRGPFDAVFCRNVAIYFDKKTQGELFARLGAIIVPDGFLYIGHSENLGAGGANFKLVGKTIYQARAQQKARDAA